MRLHAQAMAKMLLALLGATLLASEHVHAAQVRLSFLEGKSPLDNTIQLLTNGFCSEQVAAAYAKAVRSYVFDKSEFDFSRFPAPAKGFYTFVSMRELVTTLPTDAFDCNRTGGFNCFDAVILLASGQLHSELRV